ncbi:MAG TPA: adenosine deaminase [Acidimicrobiales bacterium]|jgi:adenosine deaminase
MSPTTKDEATVERRSPGRDGSSLIDRLAWELPKAELHLHLEGTLEPELFFELARRNGVTVPYADVAAIHDAYVFEDLQSFLDLYYQGCDVLVTEDDFYDLTAAYVRRAADQGVRHAEVFFDPQTHTDRSVPLAAVVNGISRGLDEAESVFGMTSYLIPCFLRHLSAEAAMATLEELLAFRHAFVAVGLDSGEQGNPPSKFTEVFDRARAEGFLTVAHAGEEGPPSYITEALDLLEVRRIDHGVRCEEDADLVKRLAAEQVPLTVCPLSNVKLRVFSTLEQHNLGRLLDAGLAVNVNSDDPAYFGGYVADNLAATAHALGLSGSQVVQLVANSFDASFLPSGDKARHRAEVMRVAAELHR